MLDHRHDFDFLHGRWKGHNRRLRVRLAGCTEWEEFESTYVVRPILNGTGNQGELRTPFWPDFVGMSFRFFNPVTQQWAIYWADSRRGMLDPPVFGSFTNGTGIFDGRDTFEGRPILIRLTWTVVDPTHLEWAQAFSPDEGATWETNWTMTFTRESDAPAQTCCNVVELRQYTMQPGRRDDLIALFDRHFIESQEVLGATVLGQFRDRRRDNRFVWLRGFADMKSRHAALEAFYGGPVWAQHRTAANATMIDSDDVLLLKPAKPETAFHVDARKRPAEAERRAGSLCLAGIHTLSRQADAQTIARFEKDVAPALREQGVEIEAVFVTEPSPNTFTRLPVREGEHVLVWFGTVDERRTARIGAMARLKAAISSFGEEPPVVLELDPTPRSLLGHHRD
jgi:ribosomal 50S subunit-recycling heat shock protein